MDNTDTKYQIFVLPLLPRRPFSIIGFVLDWPFGLLFRAGLNCISFHLYKITYLRRCIHCSFLLTPDQLL